MLQKRGDVWHTRLMFQGTLYQRSLRTRNKAEAAKLEAVFRASLIRGEFSIVDSRNAPSFTEFETRVLAHLQPNVAPRTYGFYKQNIAALKNFPPLASAKLPAIDKALIDSFVQFRVKDKVTPVTVNHSLRTLRRVLYVAKEWKLIRDVPTIKLLPGEHEREAVIDDTTLDKMTKYIRAAYPTSQMQYMLPFLVDTGLRISEACGLLREHVTYDGDGKAMSIRIVKGKSKFAKRTIPLTDRAASALDSCVSQSKSVWVFTSKGGRKPLTRHYPSEQFRLIRDALNLERDCVLHSTRHTFCTRLGKAGADAFTIQKLAGHSSITISQRYVHADTETKVAAIGLLDALNKAPKNGSGSGTVKEIKI